MFGNDKLSPEALLAIGSSLAGGQTVGQQFGGIGANLAPIAAMQKQQAQMADEENRTRAFLMRTNPALAQQLQGVTGEPLKNALNMVMKQQFEAQQPKTPKFMSVNGMVFDETTRQFIAPPADMVKNQSKTGLNLQYGVDDNGNIVPMQPTDNGQLVRSQMPEGVKLSKEPIKLDAGTHFVLLDPITRQQVGVIPKDLAGAERQKEIGTNEGKQIAAASSDLQAGQNAKDLITSLRTDPNREWATGFSSMLNGVPSTPGFDFQSKVDQAKSGAFLTAIQQMRGMGSLSNAEGSTATAAVTRMNTSTSEAEFMKALDDYEKIIDQGIERAQKKIPGYTPQAETTTTPEGVTPSGRKFKVLP